MEKKKKKLPCCIRSHILKTIHSRK
uniref:Uncharacterized protein n=1 Tax=Musa acuminata subsp. malaccensis TaxID=214687 RepID=A0A804IWS2_MUSAM